MTIPSLMVTAQVPSAAWFDMQWMKSIPRATTRARNLAGLRAI